MSFVKNPVIEAIKKLNNNKAPAMCVYENLANQIQYTGHNNEPIAIVKNMGAEKVPCIFMATEIVDVNGVTEKANDLPFLNLEKNGQFELFNENAELMQILQPIKTTQKKAPKMFQRFTRVEAPQ